MKRLKFVGGPDPASFKVLDAESGEELDLPVKSAVISIDAHNTATAEIVVLLVEVDLVAETAIREERTVKQSAPAKKEKSSKSKT